jgi:hypothetical protein
MIEISSLLIAVRVVPFEQTLQITAKVKLRANPLNTNWCGA